MCSTIKDLIISEIGIDSNFLRSISKDHFFALIPSLWINNLLTGKSSVINNDYYIEFNNEVFMPSINPIDSKFIHSTLTIINKSNKDVISLIEEPICILNDESMNKLKLKVKKKMSEISNFNLHQKFPDALQNDLLQMNDMLPKYQKQEDVIRSALTKLYNQKPIIIPSNSLNPEMIQFVPVHSSILMPLAVIETDSFFCLIHKHQKYSLADLVTFSPSRISKPSEKLFIVYQLLEICKLLHGIGLPALYGLTLKDFVIDDQLWVKLVAPNLNYVYKEYQIKYEKTVDRIYAQKNCLSSAIYSQVDLSSLVQNWIYGKISNFEYLIQLNILAGRNNLNPNHYPIIPWVIDFSTKKDDTDFSFRDLTKTKYHLCKGEDQLNLTFDRQNPEALVNHPSQTPFHVSDFLSDITCFVYLARKLPKPVLCRFVRHHWQPNHYPSTLSRLYSWTPDECIPEFYCDPNIFESVHPDLPNLYLPTNLVQLNCMNKDTNAAEQSIMNNENKDIFNKQNSATYKKKQNKVIDVEVEEINKNRDDEKIRNQFVQFHRRILESDDVSEQLHHWIDLTFGYKLSGPAAIASKNVCLQLVDGHRHLMDHGVVQLFTHPHPKKLISIKNSKDKDPLAELDIFENLFIFCSKASKNFSKEEFILPQYPKKKDLLEINIRKDLKNLGILITEIYAPQIWSSPLKHQTDNDYIFNHINDYHSHNINNHDDCYNYSHKFTQCNNYDKNADHNIDDSNRNRCEELFIKKCYLVQNFVESDNLNIPSMIQRTIIYLLNGVNKVGQKVNEMNINILPSPSIDILFDSSIYPHLSFPSYMLQIFNCMSLANSINRNHTTLIKNLLDYILRWGRCQHAQDGIQILLPTMVHLMTCPKIRAPNYNSRPDSPKIFKDELYSSDYKLDNSFIYMNAIWTLLYPLAKSIGPKMTKLFLKQPISELFKQDATCPKFLKFYHRHFISQILSSFGSKEFLNTFSIPLVEAVSGFKNFPEVSEEIDKIEEEIDDLQLFDDLNIINNHHLEKIENDELSGDKCFDDGVDEIQFPCDEFTDSRNIFSNNEDNFFLGLDTHPSQASLPNNGQQISFSLENNDFSQSIGEVLPEFNSRDTAYMEFEDGIDFTVSPTNQDIPQIEDDHNHQSSNFDPVDKIKPLWNISSVSCESIKWLLDRLGPTLSAKFLTRNLLRMLILCYIDEHQLLTKNDIVDKISSALFINGDINASLIIECLIYGASIYGEQIVIIQYFHYIRNVLASSLQKNLSARNDATIITTLVVINNILINTISISALIDLLETSLLKDLLQSIGNSLKSSQIDFHFKSISRKIVLYRLIQSVELIAQKIGLEMTRIHLTPIVEVLFKGFSLCETLQLELIPKKAPVTKILPSPAIKKISPNISDNEYTTEYEGKNYNLDIENQNLFNLNEESPHFNEDDIINQETVTDEQMDIIQQIVETFDQNSAVTLYQSFVKHFGSLFINGLENCESIKKFCPQNILQINDAIYDSFESSIAIEGNKIVIKKSVDQNTISASKISNLLSENVFLKSYNEKRKLRGNWLAYWEHETGSIDNKYSFKQIKLQTFKGHTNAVKDLIVLDSENSFLSSSRDHTVKLWSLRNCGDGSSEVKCQASFNKHKHTISSMLYLDAIRLVVSTDGNIQVWDPFVLSTIRNISLSKSLPINYVVSPSSTSNLIFTTSNDTIIRFVDIRTGSFAHSFKTSIIPCGLVRSICTLENVDKNQISPLVCIGYSSGHISTLDIRSGFLQSSWKAHDCELLEIKARDTKHLLTSSIDGCAGVWSVTDGKLMSTLKGIVEPAKCFNFYNDSILSANSTNKIIVHSSFSAKATVTSTKLRSDSMRGVLCTMSFLPLSRLLLLGSDNGDITLIA